MDSFRLYCKKMLAGFLLVAAILMPAGLASMQPASAQPAPPAGTEVLDPACQNVPSANLCQESGRPQGAGSNSIVGPNGILTRAARIISTLTGVAAVIMIIVGGIRYMLAAGDSNNVAGAKNTIIYALVGAVVSAFAQAIVIFVLNRL